jgi:hypothetical protein
MTSMTKAHWERPGFDRGTAVDQEKEIKVGKPAIPAPRDMDWVRATKDKLGRGFAGNAVATLVRGTGSAPAQEYRNPPEHRYQVPDTGAGVGSARIEQQNRLAKQRK